MAANDGLPHGTEVDEVIVAIDYDIIKHFSEHLYGSPNKAVEELVSNSFDALATATYVYIPGSLTDQSVLVWDDGISMDIDALHQLWWIARSPKNLSNDDRVVDIQGSRPRAMIGKFGIGKLASYAVGHRIAHLCRQGDRFLLVAVDYRDVPHLDQSSVNHDERAYRTPIIELSEAEAREYAMSLFRSPSAALEALWNRKHWTLAIIDELKEGMRLTEGRLTWVLGNGMPLRPDFQVWVNDRPVEPKLGRGVQPWDMSEKKLQDALAASWTEGLGDGEVEGKYEIVASSENTGGRAALQFPALGTTWVEVRLFERSLLESSEEGPRSHGFFVLVRGRLLNPDDDQLLLPAPSFGTFYRCQFIIHADGLDQDLLADRERLQRNTPRANELAVLQRALYRAARAELERRAEHEDLRQRSESLLPVESPEHFREPMSALFLRQGRQAAPTIDLANARIERQSLSENSPLAILGDDAVLRVNFDHPLYSQLQKQLGGGKVARDAMQFLDVIAVSERVFEGFLYDLGLVDDQIERILSWRDGLYRSIAMRFASVSFDEVIREVRETSFVGDKPFEKALIKLFGLMGYVAKHDGGSGRKDGLIVAPVGEKQYKFTVEAKGSRGRVKNDAADISDAAAHRDAAGASLAIVVAREFAGFQRQRPEGPEILQACTSTQRVTIVTIDVLEELYQAIRAYGYSLEMLLPVLAVIESPTDKLERVRSLRQPTVDFDFRGVLDAVWARQQGEAFGDLVPYRSIWQSGSRRWDVNFDEFERRLLGLGVLSGLIRVSPGEELVTLMQSPDIVAERIQSVMQVRSLPSC